MGASLGSFVGLARSRGYRLVGCIQDGYNAFFVREDTLGAAGKLLLPAYDPKKCLMHHKGEWAREMHTRYSQAQTYDWVDPVAEKKLEGWAKAPTYDGSFLTGAEPGLGGDGILAKYPVWPPAGFYKECSNYAPPGRGTC